MDGRMDVWPRAPCPSLNHHLRVYSRVVALKWAVRQMFGQGVKQRAVLNMLSVKIHCWQNSVCHCCWWWWSSLQPWQPPDTFNRWGPKWSKGQWMHHTQSPSLPLSNALFLLLLLFYAHSLRLLIHPPSLPLKAVLSSHLTWPAFGLISQERNDILAQQRVNVKVYSAVSDLPDG